MVVLYNIDKEMYYKIYMCVIDIHDEWEDYDVTDRLIKGMETDSFDSVIGAYRVTNVFWESLKEELDKWLNIEGYIRTYDEEKHYEIYQAVPLYKVYDKCDEWCNEGWADTLENVKSAYLDSPFNQFEHYRIVPYPAEECEFRPKVMKWTGEI